MIYFLSFIKNSLHLIIIYCLFIISLLFIYFLFYYYCFVIIIISIILVVIDGSICACLRAILQVIHADITRSPPDSASLIKRV